MCKNIKIIIALSTALKWLYSNIVIFGYCKKDGEKNTDNLNPTASDWEKAIVGSWRYQITLLSVTLIYGPALGIASILCTDVVFHLF